jgi:hypothetical protein
MAVSKNNVALRQAAAGANVANKLGSKAGGFRDEKEIFPVLFHGSMTGQGKYVAAAYQNGELIMDADGNPMRWQEAVTSLSKPADA